MLLLYEKYKPFFFLLLGVALILSATLIQSLSEQKNRPEQIRNNFLRVLNEKETKTISILDRLTSDPNGPPDSSSFLVSESLQDLYEKDGIAVFLFRGDSLVFWSSNAIPALPSVITGDSFSSDIRLLQNGWYEIIRKRGPFGLAAGFILIQNRYPYENDYLENNFQSGFSIPAGSHFYFSPDPIPLKNFSLSDRIKIVLPEKVSLTGSLLLLLFFLHFLGFIIILYCIYLIYNRLQFFSRYRWLLLAGFALDVAFLRFLTAFFHIPGTIYSSALFSPAYYSSSAILPSLGDFFVNTLLFLLLSWVFFVKFGHYGPEQDRKRLRGKTSLFVFILLALTCILATWWGSRELILNSSIPLTLSDISEFNLYSLFGLLIFAAINLSFILILFGSFRWPLSVRNLGIAFVVLATTGTLFMNHFNAIKEAGKRDLLAVRLSMERDPVAEILLSRQEQEILSDPVLSSVHQNDDSLADYILKKYFGETWHNYVVQVTICHPGKTLQIQPQNFIVDCHQYFSGLIRDFGKPVPGSHLWLLDYGYGLRNYLARFSIGPHHGTDTLQSTAYIEINSKLLYKDLGYPELLIDKATASFPDVGDHSYAFYRNGKLINSFGSYGFPLDIKAGVTDDRTRYYFPIDPSDTLVLTSPPDRLLDRIVPFSYLFFLFVLFSLAFFLIVRFPFIIQYSQAGFRERLQLIMSGILVSSLLAIGILAVYYITLLNFEKNRESLSERAHSILVELQHKLGTESNLESLDPEYLNGLMTKYSNVFFSDINLYSPTGNLIATSRPEVFENGLISTLMNRVAFAHMRFGQSSGYTHDELIGRHDYSSAYLPFFSDNNRLLGYLNLPYFARQEDLRKEISNFMMAFINIYVFLIIIGFFTTILVSNYISRPLHLLTVSLRKLTLGNVNEKLFWQRNDEVGRLVAVYNRKVDELARSAEILARSERESAWKEMARQVAHEIKNPLTPMKLSVQHLLRSWDEQAGDWDQRLRRFSATMIEQIDSLAFIASEFSDFARMPVPVNEKIDLNEIIHSSISFFATFQAIEIEFRGTDSPAYVLADRKQIQRIFTNLINNSIQAIGDKNGGFIRILLEQTGDTYRIRVSDNGSGISADQAGKIFMPNFTTKSGGMGLGLAIVKSIVSASGGSITFSSDPGKETVFTIILPVLRSDSTER